MLELAQATIDIAAWFIQPFAVLLVLGWVVSLFPSKRDF